MSAYVCVCGDFEEGKIGGRGQEEQVVTRAGPAASNAICESREGNRR